jgi:hypothetical protein
MIIRLAEQKDSEQCQELDALVSGIHSRTRFLEQRIRHRRMYVALESARLVGLITFETIERVAEHSKDGKLFSSTEIDNAISIGMHLALGFRPSGYIDNLPQGKRELIFCKDLPPA